jgi:cytochrome c-type biogenesis protein
MGAAVLGFSVGILSVLSPCAAIGRPLMVVLLLLVDTLTLSGADRAIEAWLLEHMPDWFVDLTTRL